MLIELLRSFFSKTTVILLLVIIFYLFDKLNRYRPVFRDVGTQKSEKPQRFCNRSHPRRRLKGAFLRLFKRPYPGIATRYINFRKYAQKKPSLGDALGSKSEAEMDPVNEWMRQYKKKCRLENKTLRKGEVTTCNADAEEEVAAIDETESSGVDVSLQHYTQSSTKATSPRKTKRPILRRKSDRGLCK